MGFYCLIITTDFYWVHSPHGFMVNCCFGTSLVNKIFLIPRLNTSSSMLVTAAKSTTKEYIQNVNNSLLDKTLQSFHEECELKDSTEWNCP